MRDDILTAISENQLFLHYQPQVTADGKAMVSVEALVRWQHPRHGAIGPGDFTPDAETAGVMNELGAWVLRRACRDALAWPGIGLAVNISALQLREPGFVDTVTTIVREEGLPLERLELEIVESAFIEDFDRATEALKRLRDLGVRIALDDFGTGFSSLTYLLRLPLDKIKIDKSFVDDVDKVQAAAIVHAVIALGRALGLKVTAEGVETETQQRFLRAAGCHLLQGYLFSRPVEAAEITRRLAVAAPPG